MDGETSNPKSAIRNPNSPWLIVGLGNPGLEYGETFHNAGFRVLSRIAGQLECRIDRLFAGARISDEVSFGGHRVVLVLPQTYMNRSGIVLPPLFEEFSTTIRNTIVVCDDLALPLGKIRIRQKGSAGGHNGLKSIISTTGSDEFPRVRIGIYPGRELGNVRDFVLSRVEKTDRELLDAAESAAAQAVGILLVDGMQKVMAAYNGIDLRDTGNKGAVGEKDK
jgi:PTH1 family peptidyl-tRNA hydrolase